MRPSAEQQNDPDSIGETMLDIEVIAGICPKATIQVYFSRWSEKGWVDNLDAVLTDYGCPWSAVSYGLAEGRISDPANDRSPERHAQGACQCRRHVCVSTGDDGTDDQVADGQAHVRLPGEQPVVLAVGGTSLDRSTGDEIVWFEGDGVAPRSRWQHRRRGERVQPEAELADCQHPVG